MDEPRLSINSHMKGLKEKMNKQNLALDIYNAQKTGLLSWAGITECCTEIFRIIEVGRDL